VIVQTAGGGAQQAHGEASHSGSAHIGMLQGLDDAGAVRDLILDRVRHTRSAGLGDERVKSPTASPVAPLMPSTHLAVLREIGETARRMAGRGSAA
jgi:hypothetical protein